jgi:hypothetical protein
MAEGISLEYSKVLPTLIIPVPALEPICGRGGNLPRASRVSVTFNCVSATRLMDDFFGRST